MAILQSGIYWTRRLWSLDGIIGYFSGLFEPGISISKRGNINKKTHMNYFEHQAVETISKSIIHGTGGLSSKSKQNQYMECNMQDITKLLN